MWRQNILLKSTDKELLEEADCTYKLPGVGEGRAVVLRNVTAFGGRTQAKPHGPIFLGRVRTEPARWSFVFPLELVVLVLLQKPSSR